MSSRTSSSNSPSRSRISHVSFSSQVLRPAPLSASINHSDPFLAINRAATALQKTIQSLLDAQSEALLAGGGGTEPSADSPGTSNGGATPTQSLYSAPQEPRSGATTPVRQPSKQQISLRSARKGLTRSMREFAALKEEERNILDAETQKRTTALDTINAFTSKKAGLEKEIANIQSEDTNQRATRLKSEAQSVEAEIHNLETKLYELRAKHRYLISEAKQLENAVSSKLSSYQASLQIVERDVQRFLKHPPISEALPQSITSGPAGNNSTSAHEGDRSPFYTLNPQRRTISLAQETWTRESHLLSQKQTLVSEDREALLSGSRVWSSVVDEVQALEKQIRQSLQQESPTDSTNNIVDVGDAKTQGEQEMHSIIQAMSTTISSLDAKLQTAEQSGWNLLICCIGAELEALRQGRDILAEALGVVVGGQEMGSPLSENGKDLVSPEEDQSGTGDHESHEHHEADFIVGNNEIALHESSIHVGDVLQQRHPSSTTATTAQFHHSTTESEEEDEPGPDLLISHE